MVFKRQTIALCSVEAPARYSLSRLSATSVIALLKPLRLYTSLPFAELHSLIKLSAPPVAIASPRVLNAKQVASCLCAAILNSTLVGTLISPNGLALRYSALMNWSKLIFYWSAPNMTCPFSSSSFDCFNCSFLILCASMYILLA